MSEYGVMMWPWLVQVPYELVGAAMLSASAPRRGGGLDKGGASNAPSEGVGFGRRPRAESSAILEQDTRTTTFLEEHEETSPDALWMRRRGGGSLINWQDKQPTRRAAFD